MLLKGYYTSNSNPNPNTNSTSSTLSTLISKDKQNIANTSTLRTRHNRFKGAFTVVIGGEQRRSFNSTAVDLSQGADAFLSTGKKPVKKKQTTKVQLPTITVTNNLILVTSI